MQLFARLSYLLGTGQAPGTIAPALAILLRCARAGGDIAAAVLDTPGLLDAVLKVLGIPASDRHTIFGLKNLFSPWQSLAYKS